MRNWLKMSGAATSDLDRLEEKTRSFHLSEGQIRHVYPAPVLKALLPVSVATKLKTCVGKAKIMPGTLKAGPLFWRKASFTPELFLIFMAVLPLDTRTGTLRKLIKEPIFACNPSSVSKRDKHGRVRMKKESREE